MRVLLERLRVPCPILGAASEAMPAACRTANPHQRPGDKGLAAEPLRHIVGRGDLVQVAKSRHEHQLRRSPARRQAIRGIRVDVTSVRLELESDARRRKTLE